VFTPLNSHFTVDGGLALAHESREYVQMLELNMQDFLLKSQTVSLILYLSVDFQS